MKSNFENRLLGESAAYGILSDRQKEAIVLNEKGAIDWVFRQAKKVRDFKNGVVDTWDKNRQDWKDEANVRQNKKDVENYARDRAREDNDRRADQQKLATGNASVAAGQRDFDLMNSDPSRFVSDAYSKSAQKGDNQFTQQGSKNTRAAHARLDNQKYKLDPKIQNDANNNAINEFKRAFGRDPTPEEQNQIKTGNMKMPDGRDFRDTVNQEVQSSVTPEHRTDPGAPQAQGGWDGGSQPSAPQGNPPQGNPRSISGAANRNKPTYHPQPQGGQGGWFNPYMNQDGSRMPYDKNLDAAAMTIANAFMQNPSLQQIVNNMLGQWGA